MDPDLLHSASFVDDETFVVEHEDELHLALEACHWKTKKLENVVVQDGDNLLVVAAAEEDEDPGTAVFDASDFQHDSDS